MKSVHATNANSYFLNEMFRVDPATFQQIITELKGAESEKDRVILIKNCIRMDMRVYEQ
jgi:hypothetical protein